jgi:predicted acyltransferase
MEKPPRLLSLDVMRGISVIGMILVNAVAVFHYGTGLPVYSLLLHASWAGLTLADLVFPFFIFMVGVSLPFALGDARKSGGLTARLLLRLLKRAALLFLIGLGLTLSFADWSEPIRLLGVLQRIGLTFLIAAVLYLTCGWRTLLGVAAAILVAYHGLLMLPVPDAPLDLLAPGQNFSSWLDRAILGNHIYHPAALLPFEPEGILGTLPSVAQALLGALCGLYVRHGTGALATRAARLGIAGLLMLGAGYGLAPLHPIIKAVWSSSFVLATTGLALMLFAFLLWALDIRGWRGWPVTFARAFGINAITAYVLHTYLLPPVTTSPLAAGAVGILKDIAGAKAAALLPALTVIFLTWLPVEIMQRKGWMLKV